MTKTSNYKTNLADVCIKIRYKLQSDLTTIEVLFHHLIKIANDNMGCFRGMSIKQSLIEQNDSEYP